MAPLRLTIATVIPSGAILDKHVGPLSSFLLRQVNG